MRKKKKKAITYVFCACYVFFFYAKLYMEYKQNPEFCGYRKKKQQQQKNNNQENDLVTLEIQFIEKKSLNLCTASTV